MRPRAPQTEQAAATSTPEMSPQAGIKSQILWYAALWLLIGIGVVRIVSTYSVFTNTWDEPAHLACGMELVDKGLYQYEPAHPPLARVFMAIGPYLDGSRSHGTPVGPTALNVEGLKILYAKDYWRTLTLARMGILPFFVLASLIVWLWTKRLFGKPAALIAVLLFTNIPPILGHAGVATTDIALTGTLAAALYALVVYLERPTVPGAVILGLLLGLAVTAKFSAIAFFPLSLIALLAVRMFWNRHFSLRSLPITWKQAGACAAMVFLVTWGCYLFAFQPIVIPSKDMPVAEKAGRLEHLPHAVMTVLTTPMPEGQLIRGLGSLYMHDARGHASYLFEEFRTRGWWYFFPVVLAVKSPIGFLLLVGIGAFFLVRGSWRNREPVYRLAPLLFAAAIMLFCLTSAINIGVRHILILYPLLSIVAGYAVVECFKRRGAWRYAAAGLMAWTLVSAALAHPDYLAYFNEFGGSRPERILAESDLDWGQDLARASARLKQLGARDVAVEYFGIVDLDKSGLPPHQKLVSCDQPQQWAIVSIRSFLDLRHNAATDPQAAALYSCLSSHQPAERIGKTILLYRLEKPRALVTPVVLGDR